MEFTNVRSIMKIYIKEPKTESLEAFLVDLFSAKMLDRWNCKETYLNEECTQQECHAARRSLEDITSICQTYFPEVTDKEIINLMYNTKDVHFWRGHWCGDIRKVVFIRSFYNPEDFMWTVYRDDRGAGKYSLNEIQALIDIAQTA